MTNRTPLLVERNPRFVPIVPVQRRLPLTGTQRIEAVLPARLPWILCTAMERSPGADRDFLNSIGRAFRLHVTDAWTGITDGERTKSADRLKAATDLLLGPFEGQELPIPLYATKLLIQGLLNDRVWTYPDNGAFEIGWNALAELIWAANRNRRSINAAEPFAVKTAAWMRERLNAAGYYLTPAPAIFARIGAE